MADRYVKLDDVISIIKDVNWNLGGLIQHLKEHCPPADVVPKSEVEKLELTLQGVMWSVDKWLDETDYDADPIKRAITMREKTLKIVENLKAEVAMEIFEDIANMMVLQHGFNEKHIVAHIDFELLKELKKKYTEGEQDAQT